MCWCLCLSLLVPVLPVLVPVLVPVLLGQGVPIEVYHHLIQALMAKVLMAINV